MRHKKQKGFTLIELMIVLAIAAILLTLAIPVYRGYTIRTKVSEALYLAAPIKIAVTESLQEGTAPGPNTGGANTMESRYVDSIAVEQNTGRIIMTTRNTGAQPAPVLVLRPNLSTASTTWECRRHAGRPLHVPSGCRQTP